MQARAREVQHLLKTLASANLQLGSVASNVVGASGWQMLEAVAAGEVDPHTLAAMAKRMLRRKLDELEQAFIARVQPHHRLLIQTSLDLLRFLEGSIEALDQAITAAAAPFAAQLAALDAVPGIGTVAAAALVAEIGVNMDQFPTAGHLASWAGVCPGNKQSGGKRLSSKTTKGNIWLRRILGEAAWAAIRLSSSMARVRCCSSTLAVVDAPRCNFVTSESTACLA